MNVRLPAAALQKKMKLLEEVSVKVMTPQVKQSDYSILTSSEWELKLEKSKNHMQYT